MVSNWKCEHSTTKLKHLKSTLNTKKNGQPGAMSVSLFCALSNVLGAPGHANGLGLQFLSILEPPVSNLIGKPLVCRGLSLVLQ
jgi:hypothetical protein